MMSTNIALNEVVVVSAVRTPIGSFRGSLASLSATELGGVAVKAAVERAGIAKEEVKEVYMGNVCSAYLGQSPARQAAIFGGLPTSTICTTVNKVCSSGLKSVLIATQCLQTGTQDVVIAGGMESMSNIPFYLKRGEIAYGGTQLVDGILYDGLTDVYNQIHMGNCGEHIAKKFNISKEEQDEHAINSYRKTEAAYKDKVFDAELVPVRVPQKRGKDIVFAEDEEHKRINYETFKNLQPAFEKENGTITAGNAAALNDGAAAIVMMTGDAARKLQLKPLARILGYADGECDPIEFPIAPSIAISKLLEKTGLKASEIDLWEINEPFSVVAIANQRLLSIDSNKINVHGSAVSLGHPIGMSGSRLVAHLCHVMKEGQKGVATTCNGGGGASAIMIEKL
ncbi:acetyl-CoA acetyltransferase, mitochondrial-like [Zerene cesonia]|uniref:acetyl-CoA acetyltransferase, mitochondrial-like n=1 Tax=Zerene cesonia TaxID=33412 RepID=UPI0018E4F8C5|nr:acetyl-CoA acetyltransferase, mitochondrial-like [Zerene cesonia]